MFYRANIIPYIIGAMQGMSQAIIGSTLPYLKGGEYAMAATIQIQELVFNIYRDYANDNGQKVESDVLKAIDISGYMNTIKSIWQLYRRGMVMRFLNEI